MIWIAFALLAVGVTSSIIFLASKAKYWMTALRSDVTTVRKNILGIESTMAGIAAERPLIDHAHESLRVMHETVATLHAALAKPEVKPEPLRRCQPARAAASISSRSPASARASSAASAAASCSVSMPRVYASYVILRRSPSMQRNAPRARWRYEEMKHAMDAKRPEKMRAREPLGRPIT